jgi:hypothetical protein
MQRIGVLGNPDSWYLQDLVRAAGLGRAEIVPLDFERLSGSLGFNTAGRAVVADDVPLDSLDTVIVRSMPPGSLEQIILRMDLLQSVERLGIPLINPPRQQVLTRALARHQTDSPLSLPAQSLGWQSMPLLSHLFALCGRGN